MAVSIQQRTETTPTSAIRRVRPRVQARRRARLDGPAYTLPPNADHVTIMRALVKLTLGHSLVTTLADDIAKACDRLEKKGGLYELDRRRVKTEPATTSWRQGSSIGWRGGVG